MLSIFSLPIHDFPLLPKLSSNDNLSREDINLVSCLTEGTATLVYASYYITNIILLLPLCILVLHHGFQQYQKNGSTVSAATLSHSDSFTYHLVTMEVIGIFGCTLCFCGFYSGQLDISLAGQYFLSFTSYGENFFHTLTCVERFLAVMYPIAYRSLKNERGIRVRNISVGCVWLICVVLAALLLSGTEFAPVNLIVLLLSLIVISFFSFCVLSVLIRPGPGEQGGSRVRVDHTKQKAFYTILTILGMLILRFGWGLTWAVIYASGESFNCVVMASAVWFYLPSSLVLPMLFLHRKGIFCTFQRCTAFHQSGSKKTTRDSRSD